MFVGRYEVDFLVETFIVIEVDGYIHYMKEVIYKDKIKDRDLEYAGYHVLRFTGDDVRYDVKSCVKAIQEAIVLQNSTRCYGRPVDQLDPWKQTVYNAYIQ